VAYGITIGPPVARWPVHEPAEVADYTLDVSADLGTETLSGVSVTVTPSGTGELTPSALSVTGALITVWLSGGVAGRQYVVSITATTLGGRTYQWPVRVTVDTTLATWPLAAPPSTGPGTPVAWGGAVAVIAPLNAVVATVLSAGTNQATATVLSGLTNIATGGVTSGGLLLPSITSGTIRVVNVWTSDVRVYAPGSAVIGSSAYVVVSPGVGVDFTTVSAATQWYAS
jgi:hypothetical protein